MVRVSNAKKAPKKKTAPPRRKKVEAEKKVSTESSKKPVAKDYKDLAMAYLAGGNSAVEKMVEEFNMKPTVIRKSAAHVEAEYPDRADMFTKFVEKHYPEGKHGRASPVDGEVRDYRPQQIKSGGGPFLRLPLDILDVKVVRDESGEIIRKDIVCVKFTKDKIEVWKKAR